MSEPKEGTVKITVTVQIEGKDGKWASSTLFSNGFTNLVSKQNEQSASDIAAIAFRYAALDYTTRYGKE